MRFIDLLRAYARVCRMAYIPAEGPCIFAIFFLGATSIQDLIGLHVIEAIVIFMLLFFSGCLINGIADIEVDSKYKTFISDSVRILGEKTIKTLIIVHVSIAFLLTLHLCYLFNNYWLFLWVLAGTFFGLGYSVKPFHFKVRGVFHVTLMFAVFVLIILLYYVVAGMPTTPVLLVILSFITLHYGITLVDQTQDYLEDKESGLLTPSVRWGVTRTLTTALVLSLVGLALGFIGFYILFNDLPSLVVFGYSLSFELLFIITVITLLLAYYTPLKGMRDLIKISLNNEIIEQKMILIKNRFNHPRWQISGVMGVTIVSALFFAWKIV